MVSISENNIISSLEQTKFPNKGKYKPRMKPNTPGKLNYGRTILIGLAFLTSQTAWAYYNFIMPLILREFIGDFQFGFLGADSFVGMIMILDNIVAILMLPYFGVISDHTRSKIGKRMPYILIGCTSGAIFFSLIPYMRTFAGLFITIMFFNFSMAFYRNCAISLMPDLTDPAVRSTGHSIINLMGALALSLGMSAPIIMDKIFDTSTPEGIRLARSMGFNYVSLIMLIALLVLFFTIRETPTGDKFLQIGNYPIAIDPITLEYLGEIKEKKEEKVNKMGFLKTVFTEKDKSALFMLLAIFSSFFGFNSIETYYSSFATLWLGWSDAQAGLTLMMAPVSLVVIAVPVGKLADKIGRRETITIGLIGLSICVEILHYIGDYEAAGLWLSMVVVFFTGAFYAMIGINSVVMIWELAPEGKIGAYTGAYYLFAQAAAIISPVAAGIEFDLYVHLNPDKIAYYGLGYQYRMLFVFVLVWQLVALAFLSRVKREKIPQLDRTKIKNLQEKFAEID
ncbi:MAG: MFS transporter [Candidatus Lokiarchaeota archaeon]|nr:MFS transporter [Candidatus Harpocratesius repetitus]